MSELESLFSKQMDALNKREQFFFAFRTEVENFSFPDLVVKMGAWVSVL